jgi:formylglycine-generating enzyme required for sulfatase activity/serine/threonine protein kinase
MLSPNTILQDRYRIVRELGHGGMGAVYEAIDQRVSCVVVLKETLVGRETEARRAFEREAALLANLRHPALPKVMDYFSEGDGEFLIMEFIPGYDLAELMELRGAPFPQEQVLNWADDILKLLEYLHSRQPPILHRDIKPSNLKVTKQGEVFLLDFGLAKGAAGQMETLQGSRSVLGYTPVYSPIEQIHGRGTDTRSDLYALGATLYILLTGKSPLDAPTRFAAIDEEQPDPLLPPHSLNQEISPAVSEVVTRAMAISRKQRPSSAAEMRRALNDVSKAEPTDQREEAVSTLRFRESEEGTPAVSDVAAKQHEHPHESLHKFGKPPAITEVSPTEAIKPADPHYIKTMAARPELIRPDTDARQSIATANATRARGLPSKRFALAIVVTVVLLVSIAGIVLAVRSIRSHRAAAALAATPKAGAIVRNRMGMELVWIPPGQFTMGSEMPDEKPVHVVTIGNGFYMGKYEVTQAQWQAVMFNKPSYFEGDNLPVERVSWNDAVAFITRLNSQNDGYSYRLPAESEWEYACRAETTGHYYGKVDDIAWYSDNSYGTRPVGGKQPNAFGLYDMSGNVEEWCQDRWNTNYEGAPRDGSAWLTGDEQYRVARGGSYFIYVAWGLRSAERYVYVTDARISEVGFRVVAVTRAK